MNQMTFDMEPLPERLTILERRALEEIATPKMKTAGLATMAQFMKGRLQIEVRG